MHLAQESMAMTERQSVASNWFGFNNQPALEESM